MITEPLSYEQVLRLEILKTMTAIEIAMITKGYTFDLDKMVKRCEFLVKEFTEEAH